MKAGYHGYCITTFTGWMLLNGISSEWLQQFIKLSVSARHGSSRPAGNQTFRTIDYSYHRRFVPWIFRTIRGVFVSFVPRTIRTILGLFVPSLNSDVSMKLDDADDKPNSPYGLTKASDRQTDGRAIVNIFSEW